MWAMATLTSTPRRTVPIVAINVGTLALFVVWLAVACYGLVYLVSH